jgi:hypothetical protein
MRKLFDLKFIFIAIFLLLTIAIKNSENFQLRDFDDGVSDSSSSKALKAKQATKIRYPFRKLEKLEESAEEADDDDDDDDNDSEEDTTDYTFAKVRKPTFEVKKRTNLRFSKLAQFRDPKADDDDDDDSEEKISFFTRVVNFFKRKPQEAKEEDSSAESESKENTDESAEVNSGENENDDDDDEPEDKPFLEEIFDKFKDFLEARNKQNKAVDDDDESSGDASGENSDDQDESQPEIEKKPAESKIKISIKETVSTIFNRRPFNWIFDFEDDDDDDDDDDDKGSQAMEDSEEDEINYQKLLKEEREHMQQHVDMLIKQTSEEEPKPSAEAEAPKTEDKKASPKPKKEKKSKEEAHLAQKEFEKLLLNLPSFVPDYSKVKNPECQKQGEVFQRQLRGQRIWALQMMDANAKIPSGLMRGNTNQLGDFDLCTKISQKIKITESNSMKMKGKYCLANIDVVAAADQLKLPVHLIQGRNFIRSTINDVSQ